MMPRRVLLLCAISLVLFSLMPHKGYSADLIVIDSFSAPGTDASGLTYDGNFLWSASSGNNTIYKIDTSGIIQNSFTGPGVGAGGLAFDGTNIWMSDAGTLQIYQLDPGNGTILKQFNAPGLDATGLTFDGTYLWNSDFNWGSSDAYLHKFDTDGTLEATYLSPGAQPMGLAFDGSSLWHADYDNLIYQIDITGNVISSFSSPATHPVGLTYDGTNLWVSTQSNNMIYKMSITSAANHTGLVAEYLFQGNALDTGGNNLNGLLVNGPILAPDRHGHENSAYSFDGADDYIQLPSSSDFYSTNGFTWIAWVKPTDNAGAVISAGDTIGCEDFQLGVGEHPPGGDIISDNAVWATVDNIGGCTARNALEFTLPNGIENNAKFYHIALRVDYSANAADIFVDGVKKQSMTVSGDINARDMVMTLGAFRDQPDGPWLLFNGIIDDVYFYSKALSDSEVANLAADVSPIPTVSCDVNGDGKIGLEESIFSLQVIAGLTSDPGFEIVHCDGNPYGGIINDICGVCGGNGSTCMGCDGVPNSGLLLDECGVCGGDGSSCAMITEGSWSGLSNQGLDFRFTVEGNNVENFIYSLEVLCSGTIVKILGNAGDTEIINNSFTLDTSSNICGTIRPVSFAGTFTSIDSVQGTYDINNGDGTGTWQATPE